MEDSAVRAVREDVSGWVMGNGRNKLVKSDAYNKLSKHMMGEGVEDSAVTAVKSCDTV